MRGDRTHLTLTATVECENCSTRQTRDAVYARASGQAYTPFGRRNRMTYPSGSFTMNAVP